MYVKNSICLAFSLFTGAGFPSMAAGNGTLQNGALSQDTDGWELTGSLGLTSNANAEAGCIIADGENGAWHLSIWNNAAEEKSFSMTQTISNMAAGSYTASVESVGNGNTKHNLILKAHNDTSNQEVAVNIDTKEWNAYVTSSTEALEVSEGDTVTISITGPLEAKASGANDGEWYGIRNITFDAATAVEAPIHVEKVPGLSKDFIHGVDVSTYLSEIQSGVDVGMVQIGNEINGGMAGERDWANVSKLLDAGSKAARAVDPSILIAVHYADPHRENYQTERAKALADANIDYDVFASSYYSFWHGSTENLTNVLKTIAETYHKKVMVAEVSYCTTTEDGDGAANVVNASTSPLSYSIDPLGEGQAAAVRDAIAAVSAIGEAGIGTFYWEPAWVPVGNYAGADASQKEAILASNIDKWVYTGAEGPVQVSGVDTATYTMNYKDTPQLPGAVNINLNDGSIIENVPVIWDAAQLEAL